MASKQSGAVTVLYQAWLASPAEDDLIQGPEDWDILATEPGGVDYLETDAAGVLAMWAVPKGAAQDRVLVCIHGGGFISGSIYTHRQLFPPPTCSPASPRPWACGRSSSAIASCPRACTPLPSKTS